MLDNELVVKLIQLATTADAGEREKLVKELAGDRARDDVWEKFLKFTKKEISRMPQKFRKLFSINGLRAHIRKRVRGGSVNYEVRCRMQGYDVCAGGTTVEDAKERFIDKLFTVKQRKEQEEEKKRAVTYEDFCLYYFEKFRKRKVSEETYRHDIGRSKRHIFPSIGKKQVRAITPSDCQNILDSLTERGMGKTADEVFSLMNQVFKGAIAHNIIERNPIAIVVHTQHERENGVALTKEEEAQLVNCTSPYRLCYIIALYTGLRPCEYTTIRREGDMLIAQNKKRKNKRQAFKRIPVNPMLAPHIVGMTEFTFPMLQTLYKRLRKFNGHQLYDLRTTFNTRCVECHVDNNARKLMMGHSLGVLENTYTDVSDEFLIKEAAKLNYELPPVSAEAPSDPVKNSNA